MDKIKVYIVYRFECEYEGLPKPSLVTRNYDKVIQMESKLRAYGYDPVTYDYEI